MFRVTILCLTLVFIELTATCQIALSDISYETAQSQKVIHYVQSFENANCRFFSDLTPSVNDGFPEEEYSFCEDSYTVSAPLETTWKTCIKTNPAKLWKGKRVSLSFIYNRLKDILTNCKNEEAYQMETGQIYFLNLRVLLGMYHLPTALKVTDINEESKRIVFTYLKGGKSEGRQEIELINNNDNTTQIVHKSYFKSRSKTRDKRIYPYFHHKIVHELHKNIGKEASKQ